MLEWGASESLAVWVDGEDVAYLQVRFSGSGKEKGVCWLSFFAGLRSFGCCILKFNGDSTKHLPPVSNQLLCFILFHRDYIIFPLMWNLILAECLEHRMTDKFQSCHILEGRARWSCKSLEATQPKILPHLVFGNYNVDSLDDRIKWIYPSGHENKTSRGVNCSNSLWVNVVSPVTVWSQHVTLESGWFVSFSVVSRTLMGISESWTLLGKVCCSLVYQCLKDFLLGKKDGRYATISWPPAFI